MEARARERRRVRPSGRRRPQQAHREPPSQREAPGPARGPSAGPAWGPALARGALLGSGRAARALARGTLRGTVWSAVWGGRAALRVSRWAGRRGWQGTRRLALALGRGSRRELAARVRLAFPGAALLLLLALFACVRELPPAQPTAQPVSRAIYQEEPLVRVALLESGPEARLTLPGEWQLEAGSARAIVPAGELVVRPGAAGGLELSGALTHALPEASLRLRTATPAPPGEPGPAFGLSGKRYRGELELRRLESGALQVINHVGLEDYLAGVLGHEMPLRWPDAAVEAQAIAARTYALSELKPRAPFDLYQDTRSQVYGGVTGEDARAREIVTRTRGRILTSQGQIFVTYFHSTCGGDTVPAQWIFPWVKQEIGPLEGASGCRCQDSKFYRWEEVRDLSREVKELVLELPLRELSVEHWPRGGYVKSVRIVDAGGDVETLSGWDARRAFGLRGYAWDAGLSPDGRSVRFQGRGWGHGVGLCQWGARGFAQDGLDARAILEHFYPGAVVELQGY